MWELKLLDFLFQKRCRDSIQYVIWWGLCKSPLATVGSTVRCKAKRALRVYY